MLALAWIGVRARWVLAIGVVAALLIPGPGSLMKGTLPFWVTLLLALAMARIDLGNVLARAVRPRRLIRMAALLAALMIVTPVIGFALASAVGADKAHVEALVYTMSAPPLGSAAAFCLILGLDAALALELTVLGAFIAPLSMPLIARLLLGASVPIDIAEMFLRLTVITLAAAAAAVAIRRLLGPAGIERHRFSFDGVSTICLVLFLFPLFDGITAQIAGAPLFAAATLAVAVLANLGVQIAAFPASRRIAGRETGGAAALIWGNRNAALALASLPPDPLFTLYVALYQFPMYFTPLVMRPIIALRRE